MAYSVAHLVFSTVRKKLIFGPKSNKETPNFNLEDPLRSLRPSPLFLLEFLYCFSTRFSAFSGK